MLAEHSNKATSKAIVQQKTVDNSKSLPTVPVLQLKSSNLFPPIQLNDTNAEPKQLASAPENKNGLPKQLKSGIESLSGMSMDEVKVHYNSSKPAQLKAHAYAQGSDIHVGSGQEKHLPHEAWHVVQQAQGRVKPTAQFHGDVAVNDDENLEKEADLMGAQALQMANVENDAPIQQKSISELGSIQKKDIIQKQKYLELDTIPEETDEEVQNDATYDPMWKKASKDIGEKGAVDQIGPDIKALPNLFHVTTTEYAGKGIESSINPGFFNPASRFGGGFYLATNVETSFAEINAHENDNPKDPRGAVEKIEYQANAGAGSISDLTEPQFDRLVINSPVEVEKKARIENKDGIYFKSTKGTGNNLVLFKSFGKILKLVGKRNDVKGEYDQFKVDKALNESTGRSRSGAVTENEGFMNKSAPDDVNALVPGVDKALQDTL